MTLEAGLDDDFLAATSPHRRELLAHCYRLLGSAEEAEDAVQETFLSAWQGWEAFEHRSSPRTWLYRIATNVCLTALRRGLSRVLPSGLGAPEPDPDAALQPAPRGTAWLQPLPTPWAGSPAAGDDPAEVVAARTGLRLALVASLQLLPGRQRAVLVLRDVLRFSAAEVAAMLDLSVPAVKSALQRARARLADAGVTVDDVDEPTHAGARAVLDRYMSAFERADAEALETLLRADARLEFTPTRTWFQGRATCAPYLGRHVLLEPGEYRMVAASANGGPAAIAYRRAVPGGEHEPFAVAVLDTDGTRLTGITVFADPALVEPMTGIRHARR